MKKFYKSFTLVWLFCLLMNCHFVKIYAEEEKPYLVLNNPVNAGFFAIFSSVIAALNMYEEGHFAGIHVDFNSGVYLDLERGPNWWEYFFDPIHLGDETNAVKHVFSFEEVLSLAGHGFIIPRERASELIQKYVHLRPEIAEELETFVNTHFKDHYVIGIHHRGTDKKTEAPIVPYEKTLTTLNWVISNLSDEQRDKLKVFVATDEQNFLNFLIPIFPNNVIYSDFVRSTDDQPLHYNPSIYSSNYQKGKEALLDCLLLSRCNFLLFPTTSSLSIASMKFNPNLPAIAL